MSADDFIASSIQHQRARTLGARPLPLAAGEVAVMPRPLWPRIVRAAVEMIVLAAFFAAAFIAYAVVRG